MLIILEGCDGTGKTTLARELRAAIVELHRAEDLVEVRHSGPPKRHPLDEYELSLAEYRPGRDWHIICDRWHIGELIYPKIFGRSTIYDEAMNLHVELFLRSRGALVVYVTDTVSNIVATIEDRGDDSVAASDVPRITQAYARRASLHSVVGSMHVDQHNLRELDRTVQLIIKSAERLERDASSLSKFITYVGYTRPRVLLLGDVRGIDGKLAHGDAPAFVPYVGTSGHYLLKSLLLNYTTTLPIGLANACDVDDSFALAVALGGPEIVALGRNAHCRLNEIGLAHRQVSHPQYVRRFHNRDAAQYAYHIYGGSAPSWYRVNRGEK